MFYTKFPTREKLMNYVNIIKEEGFEEERGILEDNIVETFYEEFNFWVDVENILSQKKFKVIGNYDLDDDEIETIKEVENITEDEIHENGFYYVFTWNDKEGDWEYDNMLSLCELDMMMNPYKEIAERMLKTLMGEDNSSKDKLLNCLHLWK